MRSDRTTARRAHPLLAAAIALLALLALAPAASAGLIKSFSAGVLVDENTANPQTSDYATQAGSHPDVAYTKFTLDTSLGSAQFARVDLPAGLSVNPQAIPRCNASGTTLNATCPAKTKVGEATVTIANVPLLGKQVVSGAVYNMVPSAGNPSDFAFEVTVGALFTARTDLVGGLRYYPSGGQPADYGEYFTISNIANTLGTALETSELKFWGAPEEHNGGGAPNNAFLTNPTTCAGPQTTYLSVETYAPVSAASTSSTTPVGATGCGAVPFAPSIGVTPSTTQREEPDGISLDLHVPQDENPSHIATSHLRDASVTLPAGMTIDPSAANGLQACTDAQFAAGSKAAVTCPAASNVGSVEIATPVLPAPLTGSIYVGQPQEGNRYRLFLDAENAASGVAVRLVGSVSADEASGRLTATFLANPQLPFTDLVLAFKRGAGALLANPLACGGASTTSALADYSGGPAATPASSFAVDSNGSGGACPNPLPFAPAATASPTSTVAAASTGLNLSVTRVDGEQILDAISTRLPEGMLADLSGVTLCGEPAAANGTCGAASRIGSVSVSAGAGPTPLALSGSAYITGPYGGQPFGLSIVVPAIAGPYNLGTVVVRAAVALDTVHGIVTIASDPLPSIVGGVPLRLRNISVAVERPGFLVNPASCVATAISGTVSSTLERTQPFSSPFQATGCGSLPFAPTLHVTPSATQRDTALGLTLDVQLPAGSADVTSAVVDLPPGLSLNPAVAAGLQGCSDEQFAAAGGRPVACPASSAVGSVEITTPLLPSPLSGNLYVGRPLSGDPQSGQEYRIFVDAESAAYGISVRLVGSIAVDPSTGKLTATIASTPPMPFSDLRLTLQAGGHAPLASSFSCEQATFSSTLTPTSGAPAAPTASYTVDADGAGGACPAQPPFGLSQATSDQPSAAGADAAYTLTLSRADGQQYLSRVTTRLPPGLLGRIAAVTLCPEAQANAGSCPSSSRIGDALVAAGAGPSPLQLPGAVYLTGPYGGAPYGLSVAIPAEAVGPFDFGVVVTRAAIAVDEHDAHVTVTSAPLPTIVGGAPLRLRLLSIATSAAFTVNPTSCAAAATLSTLVSTLGASQEVSSPFQPSACAALPFAPLLTASTSGQPSKQAGAGLHVQLSFSGQHGANVAAVTTSLPPQLPARLTTLQKACPEATFAAGPAGCPAAARVGQGSVSTPLLPAPMSGPAYLVAHGGAAFPDLDVILSGDGLRILLHGQTHISSSGIITASFSGLPDVPISSFTLDLPQGPFSALAANAPLCGEALTMPTTITAQNGKVSSSQTAIAVSGCPGQGGAAGAGSIARLRISPARFRAATSGASIAALPKPMRARHRRRVMPTGATVSYTDATAGSATFVVLRPLPGERRGHGCVARATRRGHRRRRAGRACVRYVRLGSFTHRDAAGANSFHFTGRLGRRRLAPGSYRLQAGSASAAFAIRRG